MTAVVMGYPSAFGGYAGYCAMGRFRLTGMSACVPLLGCSDLSEITLGQLIGQGSTKSVYRATWRGAQVALSALAAPHLRDDFLHGLEMLRAMSPSPYVVQLVGFCKDTNTIVTEHHPGGDASRVTADVRAAGRAGALLALRYCRSYAAVLAYLHDSPAGRRLMCDSSDLQKTLQQYLVSGEGRLVVADVDALPDVSRGPVLCGRRPLEGEFIAPEQRWQHGRSPTGYDEKTDIWKLPVVCGHFLRAASGGEMVALELHRVHKRCRSQRPELRPTAWEVISEYDRVISDMRME